MNGEEPIAGQLENEELEEVAGDVRADHEHLRWVGIRVDIDNDERMVHGVEDVRVRDAVTSSRTVDLHTITAYYETRIRGRARRRLSADSRREGRVVGLYAERRRLPGSPPAVHSYLGIASGSAVIKSII